VVVLAAAAAGLLPAGAGAQPQWSVLACLDTRGGLGAAADVVQQRLATTSRRLGLALAAYRLEEAGATAGGLTGRLLFLDKHGWREQQRGPVRRVEAALGQAATTAFRLQPGRHTLLMIVGHGAGLLEADQARGMEPAELARALAGAVERRGQPLDVLGLDTCFGGSIEKLWELRPSARFIVASPGLVYSPGLQWAEALEGAGGDPRELAAQVARRGMTGGTEQAAVVAVDGAALPAVVAEVRTLSGLLAGSMAQCGNAVTLVRSQARSWGRREELADLGELAAGLAANAPDEAVRASGERLRQVLQAAIVGQWRGAGGEHAGVSGVGIYFPRTVEATPPAYQQRLQFATESGWMSFLAAYGDWVTSRLVGKLIPGRIGAGT